MPIGLIMRKMFGTFNEYHNSLDDENFISFKTIMESIKLYNDVLCSIDKNFIPIARVKYGTPQLSRYSKNLYPNTMKFNSFNTQNENRRFLLETLNLSDGNINFLEICQKKNFKFIDYLQIVKKLLDSRLIKAK
jgi:aminopeptidase-like protein